MKTGDISFLGHLFWDVIGVILVLALGDYKITDSLSYKLVVGDWYYPIKTGCNPRMRLPLEMTHILYDAVIFKTQQCITIC